VYWFTAVQGTVWFAAHVVATTAMTFYVLASIEAKYPLWSGLALCAALGTRTHLAFAGIFFVLEALRVARRTPDSRFWDCNWRVVSARVAPFALPCVGALVLMLWYNSARFHDPFEVGYRYLQIAWQGRIAKWGMFSYHYLARNLGIVLTSLPFFNRAPNGPPFQISGHGLALWLTSPFYVWLLWPRRRSPIHPACYLALLGTALPTLLYQNSGWIQFGQRFSNDYSPWLFVLLALGFEGFGKTFRIAAVFGIVVNLFGAVTFQRQGYNEYYFIEPTQKVIYQPD
jgi:hypothetical protein